MARPPAESRTSTADFGRVARWMIAASGRITLWISGRWGERFPFFHVAEYPKSGGTWLGAMLADYLQIPFPQHSLLPIACRSVLHGHWVPNDALARVVYLVRDGRDVLVSQLFAALRHLAKSPDSAYANYYLRRCPALADVAGPERVSPRHVKEFLTAWLERPFSTRLRWSAHVDGWLDLPSAPVLARYEDVLQHPVVELGRVLESLTGESPDPGRLEATVQKFSFTAQTGRTPGHADPTAFARKGVVADWRNHFDAQVATQFERACGRTLRRLGYESTASWPDELT